MKSLYLSVILIACYNCASWAQINNNLTVFLSSRNTSVPIYKNPVGHEVSAYIIEDHSYDEGNILIIKDKSSLRYKIEVFTPSGKVVCGWINKVDCAVYVRPKGSVWNINKSPFENNPIGIFNSNEIETIIPYLVVLDFDYKEFDYNNQTYKDWWLKVGFMFHDTYFEGWTREFCPDINHGCN